MFYMFIEMSHLFLSSKYYSLCHFITSRWLVSVINFLMDSKEIFVDKKMINLFDAYLVLFASEWFLCVVTDMISPRIMRFLRRTSTSLFKILSLIVYFSVLLILNDVILYSWDWFVEFMKVCCLSLDHRVLFRFKHYGFNSFTLVFLLCSSLLQEMYWVS